MNEFLIYYFFHNDMVALPYLMVYMILGTSVGLICAVFASFLNVLADPNDPSVFPNSLRFSTFWGLWLVISATEKICVRISPIYSLFLVKISKRFENWMFEER